MTQNSKMKSAVILAAGLSSRMMDFKPLRPFGGTTVIQHTVSRMLEGGAEEIILVTGFLATEVERIFRDSRVRFVHNRCKSGKVSCIGQTVQTDDAVIWVFF